ncbi:hypothetical protein GCM10010123_18550 [Pilimelia anulata]|uniref:G domain-containing protein n=1 Tax=Pilimelia anulata TaxID=53371 RepID=A0A8J3B5J1_9ACTN|nr:GTPase [Pilimelia anulata]GGJ89251.1 hypothetical protein GCM10010123_18550 [Pilimelia anulata]
MSDVIEQQTPLSAGADDLARRVAAIDRFRSLAVPLLPAAALVPAAELVERAGARLALSGTHTVVALAGTTGSGKSSLFNAIARLDLSPVGVRRPTTGTAHACVWGPLAGAGGLLDWVGVAPRNRFIRESALDGDDEAALHGLVLLDLPDFDSIAAAHRVEVDRLLGLVDLIIWVVDPQKYADKALHASYLRQYGARQDITLVVLNQADRLGYDAVADVVADLKRLLAVEGLGAVPVLATSATAEGGLTGLRAALQRTVGQRQAATRRWHAEVDVVVAGLRPYLGTAVDEDAVDRAAIRDLATALGDAAGVAVAADAAGVSYARRGRAATGWPPLRWLGLLRRDPLRRLRLPGLAGGAADGAGLGPGGVAFPAASSLPVPSAAQFAAAGLAVRRIADRTAGALPEPWPAAVLAAARSRRDELPDALDVAIVRTDLGLHRVPTWWRVCRTVQWLGAIAAVLGVAWLIVDYVLRVLGLPPFVVARIGDLPLQGHLAGGGLLIGVLGALLARPLVRIGARRARRLAERRLDAAVTEVAREYVVAPMRDVLNAYAGLREALASADRPR